MTVCQRLALIFAAASLFTLPAAAQEQGASLSLDSLVELAKTETAADGSTTTRYTKPDVVVPGDRVRITLRFHNRSRDAIQNLKLRNPIPEGLQFDGTEDLAGFAVSVDGGTNWGQLAELSVTPGGGAARAATMADITNVMWTLPQPVPPGTRGSVSFFTRVR
jgi:uncharacterized repeat protein (TIGR01451 family)